MVSLVRCGPPLQRMQFDSLPVEPLKQPSRDYATFVPVPNLPDQPHCKRFPPDKGSRYWTRGQREVRSARFDQFAARPDCMRDLHDLDIYIEIDVRRTVM